MSPVRSTALQLPRRRPIDIETAGSDRPSARLRPEMNGDHVIVDDRPMSLTLTTSSILLVRCEQNGGVIAGPGGTISIETDTAALFVQPGAMTIAARAAGRLHVVSLRRASVQACAGAMLGGARRIALVSPVVMPAAALAAAIDDALATGEDDVVERAIVTVLSDTARPDAIFYPVRAVTAAIRLIRAEPQRHWTTEALAGAAAVTAPVLRRGFRDYLDTTVSHYVLTARFHWLRDRLQSGRETRSIEDLAREMNFRSASAFARSYNRILGEPPSRTRAAAVAKM